MGRRKFEVNDETANQWCELRRLGDSYAKIARKFNVDRRLVARVVKEFDKKKYLEDGTIIRREIRAEFLREHLQKLEDASWDLLQIVAGLSLQEIFVRSENITVSFDNINTETSLVNNITHRLYLDTIEKRSIEYTDQSSETTVIRSVDITQHLLEREAKTIVEDLITHLPEVWKHVEKWEKLAKKYLENCRNLNKYAKDKGVSLKLYESGLRECLHLLKISQEGENIPQTPTRLETAKDVGLWMFRSGAIRESLEKCIHSYNNLKAVYTDIETLLIPSELHQALLNEKCRHCPLP